MLIRPAQQADLLPASKVCAAAFFDESLFGDIIHPFRHQYPEDCYLYWLKRFNAEFCQADNHFFVATAPNGSDESVVGLAHWVRKRAKQVDADALLEDEKDQQAQELPPNRAIDPKNENILERAYPFFSHQWSGSRAESWYLSCLAVDPRCHGQGIGRQMVAWGFQQAEREGVCVSVISADGKDTFYKRCGFTKVTGSANDGEGNPMEGVKGGLILFRDV